MQTISKENLVKLLLNPTVSGISGNSFVGLDTLTTPKLKGGKKNEQQGLVTKSVVGSHVQVFQNKKKNGYASMVQRRLNKDGSTTEFELKPRTWGVRVEGTPIIEHKGGYYLEVIFMKAGLVEYFFEGNTIEKNDVVGLDTDKKEGKQGGLKDKVIIRTYKIESLVRVTINKETYKVE